MTRRIGTVVCRISNDSVRWDADVFAGGEEEEGEEKDDGWWKMENGKRMRVRERSRARLRSGLRARQTLASQKQEWEESLGLHCDPHGYRHTLVATGTTRNVPVLDGRKSFFFHFSACQGTAIITFEMKCTNVFPSQGILAKSETTSESRLKSRSETQEPCGAGLLF